MIRYPGNKTDIDKLISSYKVNSIERQILNLIDSDSNQYIYDSIDQLKFEVDYRKKIIETSLELYKSKMAFAVFRETICNPLYWERLNNGGFKLRKDVKASDAIRDIFINGEKYSTECATAMVIVYYKALLELYPEDLFNKLFKDTILMNWSYINWNLREIGILSNSKDYMPGDRRYFKNPEVNLKTPEWQGENVIDLGTGYYYGHGMGGLYQADKIIEELNKNRKKDATVSAFLMDSLSIPNFKHLANILRQYKEQ
jgi:protein-glutamine gamma-glutamyltransferase